MNKEAIEHRERLKVLEKHIGEYYYMIGNIHSGISDAMEEYHQAKLKLLGIDNVVGRSEQCCDEWIHEERVKQNDDTYCPICGKKLQ